MLIKESLFRKVLREEARRVMAEQTQTDIQPGTSGGVSAPQLTAARENMDKLIAAFQKVFGSSGSALTGLTKLGELKAKGRDSTLAGFAIQAFKLPVNADTAPTEASKAGGNHKLAYLLSCAVTGTAPGNYVAAALSLVGPQQNNDASTFDKLLAPKLNAITAAAGVSAETLVGAANTVAISGAPETPAPAAPAQDITHEIKSGQSISLIARDYYNIPARKASMPLYQKLVDYNKAKNVQGVIGVDKIQAGAKIILPATLSDPTLGSFNRVK